MKRGKSASKTSTTGKKRDFDCNRYFHIHNCELDGKIIFSSKEDFDRFEGYLYLLNAVESDRAANYFASSRPSDLFGSARGQKLVAIAAYSFVPTDFYILATPLVERGISRFMQKLHTAYTMYFNNKYQRTGRVFNAAYDVVPARCDEHLKYMFSRIHFAPSQLFHSGWTKASAIELELQVPHILNYRYSSANEYATSEFVITSPALFPQYISRSKDITSCIKFLFGRRIEKSVGRLDQHSEK